MNARAVAVITTVFGLVWGAESLADEVAKSSPYVVDVYDPKRNPDDDVKEALAKARAGGKRILLQVGGDWCGWCHLMSKYFKENEQVAKALAQDYLVVKINYSGENQNKDFLAKYPPIKGYPHIFVLDADGTLLHSQNTADLEEGKGYNEAAVLDFLQKWAPKSGR
jgi:thiol:disulfide interchange protein